ncbi:hypothetical protein [Pseudonocardia sp. ICBG1142]|uniref:hypothetical protein n=1 Tax=Pseudonocardia sp. ICBG1142 TaxID=2846760 RepID=UPI001CF6C750|nr:hypothetical protein [Pseudonocardia sp. ICBG1142]
MTVFCAGVSHQQTSVPADTIRLFSGPLWEGRLPVRADVAEWLGVDAAELSDEQAARVDAAFAVITSRYVGPDKAVEREAALGAAVQVVLGRASLDEISVLWHRAKELERERLAALSGALVVTPGSERTLAERSGAARMTVRRALGRKVPGGRGR